MPSLKEETGQTLVLVALGMTVLMGFVALAVDIGVMFHARRNMQIAADAGAVAAALDYKYNTSVASAETAGCAAVAANGVSGTCSTGSCTGVTTTTICVNLPPIHGYHESTGYAEVIVNKPVPTLFMQILKIHSLDVPARAVAGSGANTGCIWTLAAAGDDVSLTGSGSISAPTCPIYDDSAASNAMTITGSGSISASSIGIVGSNPGYSVTGSGSISPDPPTTGIGPAADPLTLSPPTIPTGTCSSSCTVSNTGSGNLTIGPGTYNSISNTGSGTLTLTAGNYIINGNLTNTGSGSLIIDGGASYTITVTGNFTTTGSGSVSFGSSYLVIVEGTLSLTGSGALTAPSITFYTLGADTLTGSGSMNITAPTSGAYNGVLIYQPSSDTSAMSVTGSGGDKITGILYAPAAPLTLTGSGSVNVTLDMIVDRMSVTGSGSINDSNYSLTNPSSVLSKLVMVE
jgi:hypothetical protein